ncbi:MAG: tetratricopeptide repeat protein [Acidobacteriota bacterium]|nr:tetratricopeptide repeat protein [Acidobacteriota bacterium]
MRSNLHLLSLAALFSFVLVSPANGQRRQQPSTPSNPTPSIPAFNNGSIYVQVYPAAGSIFSSKPNVVIQESGLEDTPMISIPEEIGENEWRFHGLKVGTGYEILVEAKGYETQRQYVLLNQNNNATAQVQLYLVPDGKPADTFPRPAGNFVLAPRAQHELDKAMKDLKSSKTASARKHLEKALQMAPNEPHLNFLMGWSYLHDHEASKAIPYLEKSVSSDPTQLTALLSLGVARYEQGDYAAAIDTINKASGKGLSSWQAQWILASSYLRMGNYEQARQHAEEALKIDRKQARPVQLVLGQALAGLGLREQAIDVFLAYLRKNSRDPEAPKVRAIVARLRAPVPPTTDPAPAPASTPASASRPSGEPAKVAAGQTTVLFAAGSSGVNAVSTTPFPPAIAPSVPPPPPAAVPRKVDWAPPDVEALRPHIISDKACRLPSLLKRAGQTAAEWVKDLQEFTATEEYQSVEISSRGQIDEPFQKRFAYMVFIDKPQAQVFSVDEMRVPKPYLGAMGAPVIALGGPALALVFHPFFRTYYRWSCEGLGEWRGQPAWIVRFSQLTGPTAPVQGFDSPHGGQLLPLKGIAWLAEKGDHVMHLETDLQAPVKSLGLERQHFSIDYEHVAFRSHPVVLWLPESVDVYVTLHGHSYHNFSRYSDFLLFWTGTKQVIGSVNQNNPKQ